MGNFLPLPCLFHEAKMSQKPSNKSKRRLNLLLDVPLNWLRKTKQPTQTCSGSRDSTYLPASKPTKEREKQGVTRVKVVLTKEEAAQLLAICAQGQERTVAEAVRRLKRSQTSRHGSSCGRWRPALEVIPEE
ncbi:unnamed protein product [Musa hybrid cultivar]